MKNLRNFTAFLLIFGGPFVPLLVLKHIVALAETRSIDYLGSAALLTASFAVMWFGTALVVPSNLIGVKRRLATGAWINLAIGLIDVAIYALLLSYFFAEPCKAGAKCGTYPIIWLALAWMHFGYVFVCFRLSAIIEHKAADRLATSLANAQR